ncbi:MAG TPA: hypothetical protein VN665_01385 [Candidatus Paceibacterota bacterium]|nr:hypothetical protein [Candidatus Paceibacterota bacterium]
MTAGIEEDQRKKIKALDIESYFSDIYIVPTPEHKRQKLQEIVEAIRAKMIYRFSRIDIVIIGDRLDIEMRRGKELKCVTARIQIPGGIHSGDLPKVPFDHPDFEAKDFNELMLNYPALFA